MKSPLQSKLKWLLPFTLGVCLTAAVLSGILLNRKNEANLAGSPDQSRHPAGLLYLSPASDSAELWLQENVKSGSALRLSAHGQAVSGFGVSSNGEQVIYSVKNLQQGSDIWLVDRAGRTPNLLLDCGSDTCHDPVWSPDGSMVAYILKNSKNQTGKPNMERVWLLDLARQTSVPLLETMDIFGADLAWSPDGRLLAFVDSIAKGIRIANLTDHSSHFLPARLPVIGGWSADGKKLYFADLDSGTLPSLGTAYVAKVAGWEIQPLFRNGPQQVDYSAPNPSPDGQWLAVGLRFSGASRQLWLLNEDGDRQLVIGDDPLVSHGVSQWSPDGGQLAYQRLVLGSSQSVPEIWVWERSTGQSFLAARNAYSPKWLP